LKNPSADLEQKLQEMKLSWQSVRNMMLSSDMILMEEKILPERTVRNLLAAASAAFLRQQTTNANISMNTTDLRLHGDRNVKG